MSGFRKVQHGGGCFCGAVRYVIHGTPEWSAHCHCRSCQRAIGAAFASWLGVKSGNFEVTAGQLAICNSSPGVARGFCGKCGSSLTYVGDQWPGLVSILAPTLDNPAIVTPSIHVYTEHQLPWVKLGDGLPTRKEF
jgi:hypothetical protein